MIKAFTALVALLTESELLLWATQLHTLGKV